MKKILAAVICVAVIICVATLSGRGMYTRTEYMLDTVITITADNKKAVSECFDEIKRIEKLFSVHISDSETSKINSAPHGAPVAVSREVFDLLEKACEYKTKTDGAFDITVKPLVDLWNVSGGGYVPDTEEISEAVSLVGDIILDKDNLTVTLPRKGMQIDLGGIAKGYAGDRVRDVLLQNGVTSAMADLGGNIVTLGKKDGKPWKIGLQSPDKGRGEAFATVEAEDTCVVTSGGYERNFVHNGKTYHHIIDPRTGTNPDNDVLSVTVISPDGALADALSTACFVLGRERGEECAKSLGADIVTYTKNGVFTTDTAKTNIFDNVK